MHDIDLITSKTIINQRLHEAEQDRLAREALVAGRDGKYNPALAWVGERMQEFGTQLIRLAGKADTASHELN
jgi:hypothetical protein